MPNDRQPIGNCPHCDGNNYCCTYNHFERDQLCIDSWEHRCQDCGHRETAAVRSDDDPAENDSVVEPDLCPFCGRRGVAS